MAQQAETKAAPAPNKIKNGSMQDEYTQEEFSDIIRHFDLQQGKYELDVSRDGKVKFSSIKKRWIQQEDLRDE